jgi:hypothetical protein
MESEKFKTPEENKEVFPSEIMEQFKDYIRLEHPVNIDKIPVNAKNHELLNTARIYLRKVQEKVDEQMPILEEKMKERGIDVPKGPEEKIQIYPCLGFFEKDRLFIFWLDCPARVDSIRGAIRERRSVKQDVRISYPVFLDKLPKYVGIYRELTSDEIKKGVDAFGENY